MSDSAVTKECILNAAEGASRRGEWLLVVFTADWCQECPKFKGELHEHVLDAYRVQLVTVDCGDEHTEDLKTEHEVAKLPTMLVVGGDGSVIARLVAPPVGEVRKVAQRLFKPRLCLTAEF